MKIAVIGSCADESAFNEKEAKKLGRIIAESNHTLLFSIENDLVSVPTIAASSAKKMGGVTIGFTHAPHTKDGHNNSTVVITTGLPRGGPREFVLLSSADVIICIGGGSGTLMEISMAYQMSKKVFIIRGTGGWSDRLEDRFLDSRKREGINFLNSVEDVKKIIQDIV